MKTLWLCADDYAQNSEISAGIRDLYMMQHLNAVSCMTNMPLWSEEGEKLTRLHDEGYIGLHLNFTMGSPLSALWQKHYGRTFRSLSWVMIHRLSLEVIQAECEAQFLAFCDVMGRRPDFIDGHQHVHQFPQVAQALLPVLDMNHFQGWVRVSAHPQWQKIASIKAAVLALWGGFRLRKQLNACGVTCNTSFSGTYPFQYASRYRHYFKSFLADTLDGGLIMCHPGLPSKDPADPLFASRHHEYSYLSSDAFLTDLKHYGIVLKIKGAKI